MKIGIMSDSHDNMRAIRNAVEFFNNEKVEHVFHAGDIISPFTSLEFASLRMPMTVVFGNNDGEKFMLVEKFKNIANVVGNFYSGEINVNGNITKIFMIHDIMNLELFENNKSSDLVIFGHTHKKYYSCSNNVVCVNPGECCGILTGVSTVAIYDLVEKKVDFKELK